MFKKNHHSPIFKHLPLTPKRSHFHFHLEFIPSQPTQQPTTSLKKNTKTLEGYKDLSDVKRLLFFLHTCHQRLTLSLQLLLQFLQLQPLHTQLLQALLPFFRQLGAHLQPRLVGQRHLSGKERLQANDESEKKWHSMFDLLVLDCYLKSSKETQVISCSKHEHQGSEICNTTHLYTLFFSIISLSLHIYHRIHPWVSQQPFLHLPFLFFTTLPVLTDGFGHILLHGSSVATLEVLHYTRQSAMKDYREFEGII